MTADVIFLPITNPQPTPHQLRWNLATGAIVGCSCGMQADPADHGFGTSVAQHLIEVGRRSGVS